MNYRIIVIVIHWKSCHREVKFILFFWLFYWHIFHALWKKYWMKCNAQFMFNLKCSQHNYWMVMEKVWELWITYSGLTTLAKNRESWFLPQRTWGRSEGLTGETSNSFIETGFCKNVGVFSHHFFYICIWSVPLRISC